MELTVKKLKEYLKDVPEDSIVRFQYIEEKYIKGMYETYKWNGKEEKAIIRGWETYDMPCDTATEECGNGNKNYWKCSTCPSRNRYIPASRCFIKDNQLFIDGHF